MNLADNQSIRGGLAYATATTVPKMIEYHVADVRSGGLALVVSRPISNEDEKSMPIPIKVIIVV